MTLCLEHLKKSKEKVAQKGEGEEAETCLLADLLSLKQFFLGPCLGQHLRLSPISPAMDNLIDRDTPTRGTRERRKVFLFWAGVSDG